MSSPKLVGGANANFWWGGGGAGACMGCTTYNLVITELSTDYKDYVAVELLTKLLYPRGPSKQGYFIINFEVS